MTRTLSAARPDGRPIITIPPAPIPSPLLVPAASAINVRSAFVS